MILTGEGYVATIERQSGVSTARVTDEEGEASPFEVSVHGDFLFREFVEAGQYTSELRRLRNRILERSRPLVVVDAGANEGLFGMFAEAMLGPVSLIGFEPVFENFPLLEQNWAEIDNVFYGVALSDHSGTETMHLLSLTGSTLYREELDEAVPIREVQVETLDSLQLAQVDLVKLDIEGAEEAALAGATETLDRCRPFVLCSYEHRVNDRAALLDLADAHGYTVMDDPARKLLTFEP